MFDDFKTPPAKRAMWKFIFRGIMEEMHFDNGLHHFMEGGTVLKYSLSPSFRCLHTLPQTLLAMHIMLIFLAGETKGRNWLPKST